MEKHTRRGKREGTVYPRKDGRWVAAVTLDSGKRKYFYAKTQQEAMQWLQTARNHVQDDHYPDSLLIALTSLPFRGYCQGGSDLHDSQEEAAQILYPFMVGEQKGDAGDYVVKRPNGIAIVERETFEASHHLIRSNQKENGE